MNRVLIAFSSLFLMYVSFGFYLSQYQFDFFDKETKLKPGFFYNYKTHLNIYSEVSIGSGGYSTIAEEAKHVKSKFIIYTDVNPETQLLPDSYYLNIAQLYGAKILSPDFSYSVYSHSYKNTQDYYNQNYLTNYPENQIVISHLEKPLPNDFPFDGIDAINLKTMANRVWKTKPFSTIWSLIFFPFNPKVSLFRLYRDPTDELRLFDQLSLERKTNLYLSSEVTAKAVPMTNWLIKFPSYEQVLSLASIRLLTPKELINDIESDSKQAFEILKSGSYYISIDALGDSTGFESYIYSKNKNEYIFMGGRTAHDPSMNLFYHLPKEPNVYYEVVLLKDGKRYDYRTVSSGDFKINEPGVYRLQISLNTKLPFPDANKWLTWIFTNNFYVN